MHHHLHRNTCQSFQRFHSTLNKVVINWKPHHSVVDSGGLLRQSNPWIATGQSPGCSSGSRGNQSPVNLLLNWNGPSPAWVIWSCCFGFSNNRGPVSACFLQTIECPRNTLNTRKSGELTQRVTRRKDTDRPQRRHTNDPPIPNRLPHLPVGMPGWAEGFQLLGTLQIRHLDGSSLRFPPDPSVRFAFIRVHSRSFAVVAVGWIAFKIHERVEILRSA